MSSRQYLIAANWKLNGNTELANEIFAELQNTLVDNSIEVLVCPPALYLGGIQAKLQNDYQPLSDKLKLGAQTLSAYQQGAYTGELSGAMLKEFGASYVIVGHSERRALFSESNQVVAEKFAACLSQGLMPILCVGETLEERETEQTFAVIEQMLTSIVERNGVEAFANAVIAYEPVWAIGTGKSATSEQAQQVHKFIRQFVAKLSAVTADNIKILYGGSVNPSNAAEIFAQPDVDGGLIGGASLKSAQFKELCEIAKSA
ncbi:triose-phosphate isomerase [Paraferrimonas sp. SM1919]|uniref:triose-phosphate isomerase n=1 Tax=Paraferrimonas sp. SM1919 TaxID=2662263 RepID=UPI0013D69D09|nr:triose-phosphate isomerase [Paraferrimonas sp. SM1919]